MAIKFAAKDSKPAAKAAEAKAAVRGAGEPPRPVGSPVPATPAEASDLFDSEPKPAAKKRKSK
jgi:hypothetical protein